MSGVTPAKPLRERMPLVIVSDQSHTYYDVPEETESNSVVILRPDSTAGKRHGFHNLRYSGPMPSSWEGESQPTPSVTEGLSSLQECHAESDVLVLAKLIRRGIYTKVTLNSQEVCSVVRPRAKSQPLSKAKTRSRASLKRDSLETLRSFRGTFDDRTPDAFLHDLRGNAIAVKSRGHVHHPFHLQTCFRWASIVEQLLEAKEIGLRAPLGFQMAAFRRREPRQLKDL